MTYVCDKGINCDKKNVLLISSFKFSGVFITYFCDLNFAVTFFLLSFYQTIITLIPFYKYIGSITPREILSNYYYYKLTNSLKNAPKKRMSSFPITQLTEPNSSFTLSPSFNNKIFLKEEKKLSEYKKGIIEFWNVDERLEKPKAYWQTVFEIKPIEQQHQSYFRKMCIYTKKPLPKIPKFDCHFEGIGFEIHLYHATNPIYLKEEDSQLLLDYTLEVTAKLTNKSFHCTKQQTPYLIAPLESMLHHSAFQETIDWLELRKTVTNVVKRVPENAGHLRDAILLDPMDVTKLYFTKELPERGTQRQNDLMDVYPIKGKGNTVKQINPGLCRVYPMSASVYQTIQILPEILLQMDEFLLIQQFKKKHAFNYIDDTILLEAFTSPSSGKSKNYERLEFLGGTKNRKKKKKRQITL